jgi:hypothetical protein
MVYAGLTANVAGIESSRPLREHWTRRFDSFISDRTFKRGNAVLDKASSRSDGEQSVTNDAVN